MSEESGTISSQSSVTPEPEQPRQGEAMQLGVQITPQSAILSFPMSLAMDNETTTQFVKLFLAHHPELVQELVKEAIAQKQ